MTRRIGFLAVQVLPAVVLLLMSSCSPSYTGIAPFVGPKDSAESLIGERLFREPRFSQFFAQTSGGNPNARLAHGDPALARIESRRRGELIGAFSSQAMSCVACHMVGDSKFLHHEGMRGYTDFAQRSPIPHLATDSLESTPRNAPSLLDSFIDRPDDVPFVLHYDGEFATVEDLVIGSYVGRNFGWRPDQKAEALANLVRVIREDDGENELGHRFGHVSYRKLFLGEDPQIAPETRIAHERRQDVGSLSDSQIIETVKSYVTTYLRALQLSRDADGNHNGSAYDQFLIANQLPAQPDSGETTSDYADRLSRLVQGLGKPAFVDVDAGSFGEKELRGLRIFLARSKTSTSRNAGFAQVGNCIACHAPPNFTDFKFHNTGETQDEYDSIHGAGAFAKLQVPHFVERMNHFDSYMVASEAHPNASGRFRSIPSLSQPGFVDLGAWNTLLNPDIAGPQPALQKLFCAGGVCDSTQDKDDALNRALAAFKTPSLRQLAFSDPYLHTGRKDSLTDVMAFYRKMSSLQKSGVLRNGAPELEAMDFDSTGADAMTAFLDSLNEDYE